MVRSALFKLRLPRCESCMVHKPAGELLSHFWPCKLRLSVVQKKAIDLTAAISHHKKQWSIPTEILEVPGLSCSQEPAQLEGSPALLHNVAFVSFEVPPGIPTCRWVLTAGLGRSLSLLDGYHACSALNTLTTVYTPRQRMSQPTTV